MRPVTQMTMTVFTVCQLEAPGPRWQSVLPVLALVILLMPAMLTLPDMLQLFKLNNRDRNNMMSTGNNYSTGQYI